jgi:hypothetical protein
MKIPAKENISGTLSTQGISPEMAGTQGKIMQAAGEGLASLTEKWQELRDKDETMRSTLELQKRLDEININAMQDPDIWNAGDKAKKEIDKALSETSMMISSGRAREQYLFSAGLDTQRATTAITTSLMKKQIDAGKANTLQVIDGLKKQSYLSGPQEQSVITDKINKTIDDAVNIGYFDREAGYKYKEAIFEEMRTGQVTNDLMIDPKKTLEELNKGGKGIYPDLTPKERSSLVKNAETKIKSLEAIDKWNIQQTNTVGTYELSQALINKTLTPETIKDMFNNGRIDAETASIFDTVVTQGTYEIPDNTILAKPDYFLKLLDETLGDKTEALDIMKKATIAYGKNEMGANQYAYFIQEANKKFNRQKNGLFGSDEGALSLKNMFNYLKLSNPITAAPIIAKTLSRIIKEGADNASVEKILKEEILNQYDETKTSPKEFKSIEEADKANIPNGEIVIINGKKYINQ